jgi:hypothetical protein
MKKNKIFFIEYERVGYDDVGQTIVIAPNKERGKIVGHEGNSVLEQIGEKELDDFLTVQFPQYYKAKYRDMDVLP